MCPAGGQVSGQQPGMVHSFELPDMEHREAGDQDHQDLREILRKAPPGRPHGGRVDIN